MNHPQTTQVVKMNLPILNPDKIGMAERLARLQCKFALKVAPLPSDPTDAEMDEIVAQLNRDRDRMGRLLYPSPRMHIVIADKHGKEIETIPPSTFDGLDKLINTGHSDET